MKILAYNIDYDTDGEKVDLPKEIEIEIEPMTVYEEEELISDKISEITGFCHNGFMYKHLD